jgi:hypothetical protein
MAISGKGNVLEKHGDLDRKELDAEQTDNAIDVPAAEEIHRTYH